MIGLAGLLNDSDLFKIVLCIRKRSKSSFFFFFLFSVLLLHLNSFALSRFIALLLSLSVILFYIYYNNKKKLPIYISVQLLHSIPHTKWMQRRQQKPRRNWNTQTKMKKKNKSIKTENGARSKLIFWSYFFFIAIMLCGNQHNSRNGEWGVSKSKTEIRRKKLVNPKRSLSKIYNIS